MRSNRLEIADGLHIGSSNKSLFLFPDPQLGLLKAPESSNEKEQRICPRETEFPHDVLSHVSIGSRDLNLTGNVFGGRTLEIVCKAALSFASARISGVSIMELIPSKVRYEFFLPILKEDRIHIAPRLVDKQNTFDSVSVLVDVFREPSVANQAIQSYDWVGFGEFEIRLRAKHDHIRVPHELNSILNDYQCHHSEEYERTWSPVDALCLTLGYLDLEACSFVWRTEGDRTLAGMATRVFQMNIFEPLDMKSPLSAQCKFKSRGKKSVTVTTSLVGSNSAIFASGDVVVVKQEE